MFKLFGERAGVEIYRQVIETSLREREETLRVIAEGTAAQVGADFFLPRRQASCEGAQCRVCVRVGVLCRSDQGAHTGVLGGGPAER